MAQTIDINYETVKRAAFVLRSVNHKLRQTILKLIHDNGRITVTQIYTKLKLEQSVASQHLAILRREGIVSTKREGKLIYYSVNYKRATQVGHLAEELIS